MQNCKKLVIKLFVVVFIIGMASPAHTTGILVFDAATASQTTISAIENVASVAKQIQQYQTQLQQYENQIRNTVAPAAYVWSKAQYTMNRLTQASNTLKYYQTQGGVDNYLNRYRNAGYYSSSPCFNLGVKCSAAQWQSVQEGQLKTTESQKTANDAALKGLELHQLEAPLDAAHLQLLQSNAQTAEGRLEAIQYANQLAAYQSNQLLQLRTMMVAQYNAENAREQARIDKQAMEQVAHEAFTKRLSPATLPPAKIWNVRDGF